ncbi:MAG: transposase [Thermodesulfovibrionales bacterium]
MVKRQNKDSAGRHINQGKNGCPAKATRIGPSTAYEYCSERLSPFGGLFGLVKFMDVVRFKEIFDRFYKPPSRTPELGHYNMVYGIIMLLFIGFNRIWHFMYIRIDPMLCSIFNVVKLPYVTTYWRYVDSLGINQGRSLLDVMSALRERVWQLCGISYRSIHINIDTTVETIYGKQQGGRKGHNTKNRGKEGLRPVRIPKDEGSKGEKIQLELLEDGRYKHRIFVTSLRGKPHVVIEEYDKRADCENLIGEAKREGLEAIPSAKFASNYAYFQLVMLAYNIWRSFKMIAEHSQTELAEQEKQPECSLKGTMDNTIRIARLKLLFLAAKIRSHSGTNTVKYSQHDGRAAGFSDFWRISISSAAK